MSLLTLRHLSLSFGGTPLLNQATLQVHSNEHLCLMGRNGAGKSTLLKLITGQLEPDSGTIEQKPNLRTAYLCQEVPHHLTGTVFDIVAEGLGEVGKLLQQFDKLNHQLQQHADAKLLQQLEKVQQQIEFHHAWQYKTNIESVISQMNLDPTHAVSTLSGGLIRRVLLARALVTDPDILVLDEPTNHLDIDSINWLESFLKNYKKTLIFVSHDRSFMQAIATRFIEIDNQQLYSYPGNYEEYLTQKEAALSALETQQALFDKKLAAEEAWIRQGIKARRTRNEGRVRALKEMRKTRALRVNRPGKASISATSSSDSGKIVFEAEKVSYFYQDTPILQDFSTTIVRGDKIGIIGPNGSGKTTLLKLLLKELTPTQGKITHGTNLSIAYFDQYRHQLDEEKTVQENVYNGDMVPFGDKTIHVISYLQKFLFSPQRARQKTKVLSGGERNRLLLAKLFTNPSNVLVMDEPTNDLDIETLELLEEQLIEYPGTVLLVSHDRAFINNVVTSTLVLEGNGKVGEYVGGYEDWLRQRPVSTEKTKTKKEKPQKKQPASKKLSYKDQRELDQLPNQITRLEAEIENLQNNMATPQFFQQAESIRIETQNKLTSLEKELSASYEKWELLEKKLL